MCGIVGFTTPGQDPAAAKQIVQGMADLIRHRGPDGEGCYADGTAALGVQWRTVPDILSADDIAELQQLWESQLREVVK